MKCAHSDVGICGSCQQRRHDESKVDDALKYGHEAGIQQSKDHYEPIIKILRDTLEEIASTKIPYCDGYDIACSMRELAKTSIDEVDGL